MIFGYTTRDSFAAALDIVHDDQHKHDAISVEFDTDDGERTVQYLVPDNTLHITGGLGGQPPSELEQSVGWELTDSQDGRDSYHVTYATFDTDFESRASVREGILSTADELGGTEADIVEAETFRVTQPEWAQRLFDRLGWEY